VKQVLQPPISLSTTTMTTATITTAATTSPLRIIAAAMHYDNTATDNIITTGAATLAVKTIAT
jgi:hypothetical protein